MFRIRSRAPNSLQVKTASARRLLLPTSKRRNGLRRSSSSPNLFRHPLPKLIGFHTGHKLPGWVPPEGLERRGHYMPPRSGGGRVITLVDYTATTFSNLDAFWASDLSDRYDEFMVEMLAGPNLEQYWVLAPISDPEQIQFPDDDLNCIVIANSGCIAPGNIRQAILRHLHRESPNTGKRKSVAA